MARVCQVTGKKPMVGNNVSHANNKTKRRFLPNLQNRRIFVESENRWVSLRLSNGVDADLVDYAQTGVGQTQGDPAIFRFNKNTAILQVRQETTFSFVVCMGNVITHHRALSRDLTHS